MDTDRRPVYTTPKSFLELIKLYLGMLDVKRGAIEKSKDTYETGVAKLNETSSVVTELEAKLKVVLVEVEAKKIEAEKIETVVGGEKAIVEVENAKANEKGTKCAEIKVNVSAIAASAKKDLAKAIPLVESTKEKLENLDEKQFTTIKSFASPPKPVESTLFACMCLLAKVDPNVPMDRKGPVLDWKSAKNMINNPKAFKVVLLEFADKVENCLVPHVNFKQAKE